MRAKWTKESMKEKKTKNVWPLSDTHANNSTIQSCFAAKRLFIIKNFVNFVKFQINNVFYLNIFAKDNQRMAKKALHSAVED